MVFKFGPRDGNEIPESAREGINAQLHELPPFREYVHDLIGVVLYFPRTKMVMVPNRLTSGGGSDCVVIIGNETYPRGGYNLFVSKWELQRAERVHIATTVGRHMSDQTATEMRTVMGGQRIFVEVEPPLFVPRETPAPAGPADPIELFHTLGGTATAPEVPQRPVEAWTTPEQLAAAAPMSETCPFLWAGHQNEGELVHPASDHKCSNREPGHGHRPPTDELRIHVCRCGAQYDPANPPKIPGFDGPGKHSPQQARAEEFARRAGDIEFT